MSTQSPAGRRPAEPGAPRRRRRTALLAVAAIIVVAVAGVVIGLSVGGGSSSPPASTAPVQPSGPEGIPLQVGAPLAPLPVGTTGQTIDGIQCNSSEQVAYHIHTHLAVYVNGRLRPVPAGIGIVVPIAQQTTAGPFYGASRCYYWLHVHAQDGVIHVESPVVQAYTLGQFFDLWDQPLNAGQVGPVSGPLTVFVDGRRYLGDPRAIPLESHEDIQIDVGAPEIPPQPVNWSVTSL